MSGSDGGFAVTVDDLHVRYRTAVETKPTLRSSLRHLGRGSRASRTIDALNGITFGVPHGIVLGVIGRNGAGKSTLLRTIAGIIPPSAGRVRVEGRVFTVLALGVGFNRELTGRENVLLGGLAAGLEPEELLDRFESIQSFAELDEAMDYPMRSYSQGMYSRLAFSVAAHVDPDVLLVDEALTAGDAAFREKCSRKMQELCDRDVTILLVSHGLAVVKDLADRCLWLDRGRIRGAGDPAEVIADYLAYQHVSAQAVTVDDA